MGNQDSERTESATPRRREKEREKGNVPKSQDLTSALMVTLGVALVGVFFGQILTKIQALFHSTFTHLNPKDINVDNIFTILLPFVVSTAQIVVPFLIILMVAGIIILRMEVGAIFAPERIKFDLANLAPSKILNNAKKMFNPAEMRNIVEFVKSITKLLIVLTCGYSAINSRKDELLGLLGLNINTSFAVVSSIITQMVINMCVAMIIIGILDKKYQDYEYEKSIKMSKQDVKDEYKDIEGDPKVKARIRSIQMKMAQNRMMSNVPKATVVVTNPTHYAVALQYNRVENPAPKVVAKGVDFVAFKIREIAQNNNVPIIENPPLARALYKLVPIDGIIPSDMFVAVAEVLAYVYSKDKRGR